ncbi:MAG: SAM-dependent methyltransferase [Proteobacteria bacterium]|nr:SAM-dependent methyltransferase [Pseudomonadota bacterium]
MPTLQDHLKRRIADEGPITVADYMNDALGHPRLGYYMGGDPIGRDGDFITAPEISQMFGELIGLWCAVQWRAMGEPTTVNVVELGPGRGTLMADVLRAGRGAEDFLESIALSLVEISPVLKGLQEETLIAAGDVRSAQSLRWLSDFSEVPDGPLLVIANEFLDALPVHQFQMTAEGWRERLVGIAGESENFQFTLAGMPPGDGVIPAGLNDEDVEDGAIIEVRPAATALIRDLAGRLGRQPGSALLIDYGHAQTAAGDTLQAVKGHQYHDPLVDPGMADLTAHVDFGALGRAASDTAAQVLGPVLQGDFLNSLGIKTRADALVTASPAHQQEIMAGLTRLTSGEAMGRLFKVMALTSPGMAPPPGFQ